MKARGPVLTKQSSSQTAPVLRKNNRISHGLSLSKTEDKTSSKTAHSKESAFSKLQTLSGAPEQDGKQCYNTDSDREMHHDFSEIWPSTEPSSPSDTATSCMNGPILSTIKSSDLDTQQGSVLARYVDRFRHGQPQSREDRQQLASNREEKLPFWWTSFSSTPLSSPPEKTNHEHRFPHHNRSLSPCRASSKCGPVNTEILQLQERASRLLQKGEDCLCEESIPVSPDGLGCSDFSSPVSADEPVRRPIIPSLLKYNTAKDSIKTVSASAIPTLVPLLHPEEDILFQWRLRRKMEKAKERTQFQQKCTPHGWQDYNQSQPLPSEHPFMPPQRIHPPDVSRETTHLQITAPYSSSPDQQPSATTTTVASNTLVSSQAFTHVPCHMHLLCDIWPYPNQSSHPHAKDGVSQTADAQSTILPQTNSNSEIKHMSLPKSLRCESIEKDVPVHNKKSTEALKKVKGQIKHLEKNNRNVLGLCKEQKKSSGVSKKMSTELCQQKYNNKDSNMKNTPPPSPIHGTLKQVVSEVLFPSTNSSPAQRIPVASPSPSYSAPAPPQYNSYESLGVISQLLQEADDSDEKEFEDDPLLKVLRKQRKLVKEQINEVDTLLKEFND